MVTKPLGKLFVNLYGLILILILIFTHFNLLKTFKWGSYPLGLLYKINTGWEISIAINFGLYGFSILCVLIQARLIYYVGNIIENVFRKTSI